MTDRAKRGACSAGSRRDPGIRETYSRITWDAALPHSVGLSSPHDTIPSPLGLCVGSKPTPGWASRSPIVLSHAYLLIEKKIPLRWRALRAGLSQVAIATHKSTTPGVREIGKSRTTRQHSASQSRLEYGFIQTNAPAGGPWGQAGRALRAPTAHTSQSSCGRGAGKETKERLCSSLI